MQYDTGDTDDQYTLDEQWALGFKQACDDRGIDPMRLLKVARVPASALAGYRGTQRNAQQNWGLHHPQSSLAPAPKGVGQTDWNNNQARKATTASLTRINGVPGTPATPATGWHPPARPAKTPFSILGSLVPQIRGVMGNTTGVNR